MDRINGGKSEESKIKEQKGKIGNNKGESRTCYKHGR